MTNLIKFQNNELEVISINGTPYLRGSQIGSTLGLRFSKDCNKIYRKHRKEFTDDMMMSIELPTNGGRQLCSVYSPRGAALIAMYAQTPIASKFRAWILDVLEGKKSTKAQEEQMQAIRLEILRLKPEWQKILHYNALGLTGSEIAKLMKKSKTTINENLRRMRACGFPTNRIALGGQKK